MAIRIVRLGADRHHGEGLRIGAVRRPPRGLRKEEVLRKGIYDVWFPNLAPSEDLLRESRPSDDASWNRFKRRYLTEMKGSTQRRDIDLLAALSRHTDLSIGCYCEDESRCHRSLLRDLLERSGADVR